MHLDAPLILKRLDDIRELGLINRHRRLSLHRFLRSPTTRQLEFTAEGRKGTHDKVVPTHPLVLGLEQPNNLATKVSTKLALLETLTRVEEVEVDQAGERVGLARERGQRARTTTRKREKGTYGRLLERLANESTGLINIFRLPARHQLRNRTKTTEVRTHLDMKRVPHPRMRFREANHRLELPSRRRDPPIVGARIGTDVPHLDVRLDEGFGRFGGEDGVDVVARPGDVRREVLDLLRA